MPIGEDDERLTPGDGDSAGGRCSPRVRRHHGPVSAGIHDRRRYREFPVGGNRGVVSYLYCLGVEHVSGALGEQSRSEDGVQGGPGAE